VRGLSSCFEVLDVFEGFARLERRSPTLDGAVPVRVAQACVPLLEGNAHGFQVCLSRPLRVRRHLGRLQADADAALLRLHAAGVPRLVAHRIIARDGAWHRALRRGPCWFEGAPLPGRRPRLRLFTGLLLKPDPGIWLRLTAAANRRNTLIDVRESVIPDEEAWVPLVLDLTLPSAGLERVRLEGEVACLAPLQPGVRITACTLAEARDVGQAHVDFYDQAYFDRKRHEVTGKYRRLALPKPAADPSAVAECRVVSAGPARFEIVNVETFTTAAGPRPRARPGETRRLESVVFRNHPAFSALYDGHWLTLDYDQRELAAAARAVEKTWEAVYGAAFIDAHRGALLYLTKLFTPHPPGEPHFFVKPWAFTQTPPGWSSLLDGIHGDGYDVLRGVVATDVFHATPAVFRIQREGSAVRVAEDAPTPAFAAACCRIRRDRARRLGLGDRTRAAAAAARTRGRGGDRDRRCRSGAGGGPVGFCGAGAG
jgi:hypothetical protein